MSATTVKLLRAAAEVVGGKSALARRLGINEALLSRFMANRHALPDALLLAAVDVLLENRQSQMDFGQPVTRTTQEPLPNG